MQRFATVTWTCHGRLGRSVKSWQLFAQTQTTSDYMTPDRQRQLTLLHPQSEFSPDSTTCRLGGSKVYADRSKECLLDMMSACKLRGKTGRPGFAYAATLLMDGLLDDAWLLMGKSKLTARRPRSCYKRHSRCKCSSWTVKCQMALHAPSMQCALYQSWD